MMKTVFRMILAVMLMSCIASCKKSMLNPIASGRPYEVLVVMDTKQWEAPVGRSLFDVLDTDVPGLPQSERSFRISQIEPKDMNNSFKIFRNVINVAIDPHLYTQTKLKFTRNKYAMEQVWMVIQSPSEEEFIKYCTDNRQYLVDLLTRLEMNRLVKTLEEKHSQVSFQLAKELFDCEVWAPEEIRSYKKGQNFFWTSNNAASGIVNMCMYSYPYYGPETFNKEYVLRKRDSVMMRNIPGEVPGMYMATDTLSVECKPITVHGKFAYESRGLWIMQNDGMGGPFVSHSRVDTTRNLVIVVEGFVYAPEKMKRGLMRRMEGSLYTLKLPWEVDADAVAEDEESSKEE